MTAGLLRAPQRLDPEDVPGRGRVNLFADLPVGDSATPDVDAIHDRDIRVRGALGLIVSRRIDVTRPVAHRFGLPSRDVAFPN